MIHQIMHLTTAMWYRCHHMHVIVMGDFNATTHCRSIDWFLKNSGLRDSRTGFGLQNSWPAGWWPFMICIDHAFVSEHVHVHSRQTARNVGSDHLPVLVELSFGRHPGPGISWGPVVGISSDFLAAING